MENGTQVSLTVQNGSETFVIPTSLTRNTVLYFMRAQSCPQCNRHARELSALSETSSEHGVDTIIIVPEDTEAAERVKDRNRLTVPVMAGNGSAHHDAGLNKKLLGLLQQSATVVIDPTGKVLYRRIATNPENSFDKTEYEAYLQSI